MKDPTSFMLNQLKRSMKHCVEELKDRDDFERRLSEGECATCKGNANILEYRIFGQEEWKPAFKDREIECKACADQREVFKILERDKTGLHKQLSGRFEKEYWHIPDDLKNAGFKNFKVEGGSIYDAKRTAMDFVKTFIEMDSVKRYNLLLMGNTGAGKTHLAIAIARTLKEKGFLVGVLTTGTLLSIIKATFQKGASQTEKGIFNDLRKFDLLVLDDIGSEARGKDEFDWSKSKLYEIVNHRVGKPTIYTSNFNEQHLPTAIGERVFSRLYNNTKFIELVTDDYRKKFQIRSDK